MNPRQRELVFQGLYVGANVELQIHILLLTHQISHKSYEFPFFNLDSISFFSKSSTSYFNSNVSKRALNWSAFSALSWIVLPIGCDCPFKKSATHCLRMFASATLRSSKSSLPIVSSWYVFSNNWRSLWRQSSAVSLADSSAFCAADNTTIVSKKNYFLIWHNSSVIFYLDFNLTQILKIINVPLRSRHTSKIGISDPDSYRDLKLQNFKTAKLQNAPATHSHRSTSYSQIPLFPTATIHVRSPSASFRRKANRDVKPMMYW